MWTVGWLAAAGWAAAVAAVSALDTHRVWGAFAAAGYLVAAAVSTGPDRDRTRAVAVGAALAGAVVAPLVYLLATGAAQSEVEVIERSGRLLVEHATPYLDDPRSVVEVTPYLPGMALLGLPRAVLGGDGPVARVLGDARPWCAAVLLGCLWAGGRGVTPATGGASRAVTPGTGCASRAVMPGTGCASQAVTSGTGGGSRAVLGALVASPVIALPLAVSGVDLPLAGLLCLALAFASRNRPVAAGLALAAACSMKWTAWPAVCVVFALLAHRAGLRAAVRGAVTTLAGTAVAVLPGVLLSARAMAEQVFAFPTGRGEFATPASSPLPGRLLADLGPAGWYAAVGLLLAAGLAIGVSLVLRPPGHLVGAADRLALGLSAAFLLAPAGRFGYLALPVLLTCWARAAAPARPLSAPALVSGTRVLPAALKDVPA
ncbi:hypothetical protein ACFV4F_22610 [Kitasatospora sp. NPDC059722]|uniref:hypothetical protein n=1 Tax=Kitasatospora sp. NPDC059722 TaxID=3346925 RepID=UPI003676112D